MAVTYDVVGRRDDIRLTFTDLPDSLVFLRVERRKHLPDRAPETPIGPGEPTGGPTVPLPDLLLGRVSQPTGAGARWSVALSWTNSPEVSVNVERRINEGVWTVLAASDTSGDYTDSELVTEANTGVYEYRLARGGEFSNAVSVRIGEEPPALQVFAVDSATAASWDVKLRWSTAVAVKLERRVDSGEWTERLAVGTTGSLDETVLDGSSYEYRLVRGNLPGEVFNVPARQTEFPGAPALTLDGVTTTGTPGTWRVSLSWPAGDAVNVERRRNYSAWSSVDTGNSSGVFSQNVSAGRYDYRLNFNDNISDAVEAIAGTAPPDVSFASARNDLVQWNNSPTVAVDVYRSLNFENWSRISTNDRDGRYFVSGRFRLTGSTRYRTELNGVSSNVIEDIATSNDFQRLTVTGVRSVDGRWIDVSLNMRTQRTNNMNYTVERRFNEGSSWVSLGRLPINIATASYSEIISSVGVYEYRAVFRIPPSYTAYSAAVGITVTNSVSTETPTTPLEPTTPTTPTLPTGSAPVTPPVPRRSPVTVFELARETVTGCRQAGEVFNLPRVVGSIRGADGDEQDWIWIVEKRTGFSGSIVLRYNPVSGQGWLFTTTAVSNPIDIAATETTLLIVEGNTVQVFDKPTGPTGDAPKGVLQNTDTFDVAAGSPSGISWHNNVFYMNIDNVVGSYSLTTRALIQRIAASPKDVDFGVIAVADHGMFMCVRGAANPVTFWKHTTGDDWQVLQTDVETRLNAVAAVSDSVLLIDRDAGVISPYETYTPEIPRTYTDITAPLSIDWEYRVGAQGFAQAYETGVWTK